MKRPGLGHRRALLGAVLLQVGLEVDDGCAVDRLERADRELQSVDAMDGDSVEPEWVRPIRRPRREDAREWTARVVAWMHLQDVPVRLVQPRHDHELVARDDPLERVCERRLQEDPRVGCSFAALARGIRSSSEGRVDDPDRPEHVAVVHQRLR
jgi:hypothetical protein